MTNRPLRHRRSCLSVPATQPRFHACADRSLADQVFLDLEDSVAPAVKERARALAVQALGGHEYAGKLRCVRVNACDTPWCFGDIIEVVEGAGERLDCLVIPKVEGAEDIHFVATLLGQLELKLGLGRRIGLEVLIESARGLDRVSEIAAASDRIEALILGPGDLAASMGIPVLTIGDSIPEHFLARIVVAARANGLQAIDGPHAQIRDLEGLRASAQRSAALGYDGKWALHPTQAAILNEVFSPRQAEYDRAWAIVEAYRHATEVEQVGAVMLGDEMIDEATRRLAAAMVDRGAAMGMEPSETVV